MSFVAGSLADGQVATTTGAIYTVPASTVAVLRSVSFFNTNATTQTLNVYVTRSGGTRRQIFQASMDQNTSLALLSEGETLALSTGDVLEADTTTATAVDYLVTGAANA